MDFCSTNASIYEKTRKKEFTVYESVKRAMDIVLCLIACTVAIPLILITCLVVVLESRGNPIFVQKRVGMKGRIFHLYKIRSMVLNAEELSGPKWADKNDSRITRVGAFIRKTRLDELPQLFNILKGDMSIVGPRPERPGFSWQFERETPGFLERVKVRPGLTGYAQVNGGYDISYEEKLRLDLEYISNRSLWLDLKIMAKTFYTIFSGEGAR
ncbi:MAG: sugar transferase [Clostridia bacterium]|nr:sugar transferase [Clostridia bacterium]